MSNTNAVVIKYMDEYFAARTIDEAIELAHMPNDSYCMEIDLGPGYEDIADAIIDARNGLGYRSDLYITVDGTVCYW